MNIKYENKPWNGTDFDGNIHEDTLYVPMELKERLEKLGVETAEDLIEGSKATPVYFSANFGWPRGYIVDAVNKLIEDLDNQEGVDYNGDRSVMRPMRQDC